MSKETPENTEGVNAVETAETGNVVESVGAAETVTDAPVAAAKPSRFAASLARLQQTPKWALITVPVLALALGGYGYMQKKNHAAEPTNAIAMQQAPAPVAGPYNGLYYGPANSGYGNGYANSNGYGNGYGNGRGYGSGHMNTSFSFGFGGSANGGGYGQGNGAGYGNGQNYGYY